MLFCIDDYISWIKDGLRKKKVDTVSMGVSYLTIKKNQHGASSNPDKLDILWGIN